MSVKFRCKNFCYFDLVLFHIVNKIFKKTSIFFRFQILLLHSRNCFFTFKILKIQTNQSLQFFIITCIFNCGFIRLDRRSFFSFFFSLHFKQLAASNSFLLLLRKAELFASLNLSLIFILINFICLVLFDFCFS